MSVGQFGWKRLTPKFGAADGLSVSTTRFLLPETAHTATGEKSAGILQFALNRRTIPIRGNAEGTARKSWKDVGQILFTPPDVTLGLIVPKGLYDTMVVRYPIEMLEEAELPASWPDGPPIECARLNQPAIRDELSQLVMALSAPRFAQAAAAEAASRVILYEIVNALRARTSDAPKVRGGLAPWRKTLIASRIMCEDSPLPSIAELAALCGMSVRHLTRAYHQETGLTLGQMIQEASIARAKYRLAADHESISKIAVDLGFASATSFAVAFKREVGILPSEFRRGPRLIYSQIGTATRC